MAAIFKRIFVNKNVQISVNISLNFIPSSPMVSIGSHNGMASSTRQVIIWTNDGLVY